MKGAAQAGIDAASLSRRVRDDVESYLSGEIDLPDDMAEAFWVADTRTDGELGAYLRWRCDLVTSLIRDIRDAVRADATVAVIPSVARPTGGAWYEGSDLCALAEAAGTIEACFYEAESGPRCRRRLGRPPPVARHGNVARHSAAGVSRSWQPRCGDRRRGGAPPKLA